MTNLLPVESWRRYFGYNPYHFFGLANAKVPVTSACNTLVWQYEWQTADAVGRAEIAQAIEAAEARLQEYLGFSVAPHYVTKTYPYPHYGDPRIWRQGIPLGADGRMIPVNVGEGYVQAVGTELLTDVGDYAVVLTDVDGDGITDTFSISFPQGAVTDLTTLGVYFRAADRPDSFPNDADWRIRPVKITALNGTVTLTGRAYLIVNPIKYEGVIANPGNGFDPNITATYVAQLHVSVRTTFMDGQTTDTCQGTLLWETVPCAGWWGCYSSYYNPPAYSTNIHDPAAVGMSVARVGIHNARLGDVLPAQAVYDVTTAQWRTVDWSSFQEPDRVTLRFLAGYPLDSNGFMDSKWQVIVARMAAAELARPICACDSANQQLYHWQFDVSRAGGANSEQYSIAPADLDNPFGTRRGHVWAWKQVRNLRTGHGTRVG